jgi:hypothetical protein
VGVRKQKNIVKEGKAKRRRKIEKRKGGEIR